MPIDERRRLWQQSKLAGYLLHEGEVGGSQKNGGRQRLSVSLADGERNTKGRTVRTSIHWDESTGEMRSNLLIQQPPKGAPHLNTGSRLYRATLAPAAAPPGRPRYPSVFPQSRED